MHKLYKTHFHTAHFQHIVISEHPRLQYKEEEWWILTNFNNPGAVLVLNGNSEHMNLKFQSH